MIMTIEDYIKRKKLPKEGDIIIICGECYQIVNNGQVIGCSDSCKKCSLDGLKINNRECIYSFIESTYGSCAEFVKEPYIFKKVRKKFRGI